MKIAFLGLGLMGAPMAMNLLRAGHSLTVYNRTREKCEPFEQLGATVAATPAEAARGREAILLCVEDTKDVEEVLFGPNGVVLGLGHDMDEPVLIIDHSTISATAAAMLAERLEHEGGAFFMDAPVSGGDVGAKTATLSIMCGGPVEMFDRALPLLQAMGKTITHVGTRPGDGQRAKMLNQMIVAINCLATTEAMRLGETMGLNMDKVMSAISHGAAASWSLTNLGPRWLKRDFSPGFRLRHLLKDIRYGVETIEDLPDPEAFSYPATELALIMIQRSVQAGNGDENIHALAKVFLDQPQDVD